MGGAPFFLFSLSFFFFLKLLTSCVVSVCIRRTYLYLCLSPERTKVHFVSHLFPELALTTKITKKVCTPKYL